MMVLRVSAVGEFAVPLGEAEVNIGTLANAAVGVPLPHVTVVEAVYQVVGQAPGVPRRDSLGVVGVLVARGLTRKQRYIKLTVVLQVAAHKEAISFVENIVDLRDIRIQHRGVGGRPDEGTGIQAIACVKTVGQRKLGEGLQRIRVDPGAPGTGTGGRAVGIHGRDLGSGSASRCCRRWYRTHCLPHTRRWGR